MNVKSETSVLKGIIHKLLNTQEFIVLLPLIALCAAAYMINANFLNPMNLGAMAKTLAPWGILAIGESLIIISGEIDISVGSMVSLGVMLFTFMIERMGLPITAAALLLCLATIALSFINGICIVKLKIPAFLATIAMLYICKGFARAITNARPIAVYTPDLEAKMSGFKKLGQMEFAYVNCAFILFVILIIVFQFILKNTSYGRKLYATGDNIKAAAVSGINTDWIKISAYLISGLMVGIVSILIVGKEGVGSPNYGEGWELTVVAATAIGGISLVGGSGTMIGTFIGAVIMAAISNVLILTRVNQHYQSIVLGVIIALSVVLDVQRRNKMLGR